MHFISIIVTSAPPQIISIRSHRVGTPALGNQHLKILIDLLGAHWCSQLNPVQTLQGPPSQPPSAGSLLVCWSLSHVRLFATPWTAAHQAPLSMGFSRQNIRVSSHFLLQGIFPTPGWNLCLLNCRQILYCLSHQGSPQVHLLRFSLNISHLGDSLRIVPLRIG